MQFHFHQLSIPNFLKFMLLCFGGWTCANAMFATMIRTIHFISKRKKKSVASVIDGHGKKPLYFMLCGTEARAMIFYRLKLEKKASSRSAPPTTSIHIDSKFVHLQTPRYFLGVPGVAVVQQSGAEGCGEQTRTAC